MKEIENDFYRQATSRICGNLDIEKAMPNTLEYLEQFMPADWMAFTIYHKGAGTLQALALADKHEGRRLDSSIELSSEFKKLLELEEKEKTRARIINDPSTDISNPVMKNMGLPMDSSWLAVALLVQGAWYGTLHLGARGTGRYNENHAQRLAALNEPFSMALSNYLRYREIFRYREMLADENQYLHEELQKLSGDSVIGAKDGLKLVMDMVGEVAPMESPVVLYGETGVGKELIANTIHKLSPRKHGPLIKVNCGAIPESLMDSELFGHEKGAFTGALKKKKGLFERADNGTLFLDEIGELTPGVQVRLLRVLQEKEIQRVGGEKSVKVNIRIVAATHRNLQDMVRENLFREDLWFRINVFPIMIPPLRNRIPDIPLLAAHIIQKKAVELRLASVPSLKSEDINLLQGYAWPGNVRELENVIERALILGKGKSLDFYDLLPVQSAEKVFSELSPCKTEMAPLDETVSISIRQALDISGGRVNGPGGAADLLKVHPNTLRYKMKKLGIPFGRGKR